MGTRSDDSVDGLSVSPRSVHPGSRWSPGPTKKQRLRFKAFSAGAPSWSPGHRMRVAWAYEKTALGDETFYGRGSQMVARAPNAGSPGHRTYMAAGVTRRRPAPGHPRYTTPHTRYLIPHTSYAVPPTQHKSCAAAPSRLFVMPRIGNYTSTVLMNRYFGVHVLDGEWHALLPRYLMLAHRIDGKRILDIGCGTGIGSSLLLELGAERVDGSTTGRACWIWRTSSTPKSR